MTDINNNHSDQAEDPSVRLRAWILSHTDPNKDPWRSEEWRAWDVVTSETEQEGEEIPRDPTLGRESDEDCVIVGPTDHQGRPEGNVTLRWSNGDTFQGCYVGGVREGAGLVSSPANNILALTGVWTAGWLQGKGSLVSGGVEVLAGTILILNFCTYKLWLITTHNVFQVTKNTTVWEAWFRRSCFHGPVRVIEMKKFRQFCQERVHLILLCYFMS